MNLHPDKISIALATYNGALYIDALLASLAAQTHKNFELVISDDGSTDDTISIINRFQAVLDIKLNPDCTKKGILRNFENALNGCFSNYIALCDQDDVWEPQKLALLLEGAQQLEHTIGVDKPVLIFSDLEIVDENLKTIDASFFHHTLKSSRARVFEDFLLGNHVPGCAMFFNRALLRTALPFPAVDIHDWWLIQVAALKGALGFVDKPLIKYRQHSGNSIGLGTKLGLPGHLQKVVRSPLRALKKISTKTEKQTTSARKNLAAICDRFYADVSKNRAFRALLRGVRMSDVPVFFKAEHGFRTVELIVMLWKLRCR
jgi:glycosyltransferase involved in cell wall biosynthesis